MTAPALRVGVTLALRDGAQSIWENGIFQNCAFLVQSLLRSPAVAQAALLVNRPQVGQVSEGLLLHDSGLRLMGLDEAMQALDVVIEMSAQLDEAWALAFSRRGGRYVSMRVGNDYVIDVERALFGLPPAGLCSSRHYDAVWTLPQYVESCSDYFGITARAPVRELPHLWSPMFLQRGITRLAPGVRFGFQPGRARWRLCCFEPNMCMVKTGLVALLGCELAYRAQPARVDAVHMCNMRAMREHPGFGEFVERLDLVRDGVAGFEERYPTCEFMAALGDCVISHQWENEQNYLHYELLHGGYPLVHNSTRLRGVGYPYEGFDCEAAARAVLHAMQVHDEDLASYRAAAASLLRTLHPEHPANVECYTRELLRATGRAA
jgi:hypothetical protein